jgi:ATP-dependent RNA helicase DDX55/SPB4
MQYLLKRQKQEEEYPLQSNEVGAIIISPTRELAEQIYEVTKQFTMELHFSLLLLIGGHDISEDVKRFREEGANVIVATPGRLDEFIKRVSDLQLKTLEVLILDEADRFSTSHFI